MGHHTRSRLQFRLPHLTALALRPERAHGGARFLFQSAGEINDGATGIAGALPVLTRTLRVGGKEGEVYARKLLRAHALDEVDFVARAFELADRLVIVEQAHIHGGKVALVEHLSNFLPFERSSAHDRRAIELAARGRGNGRCRDFGRTTHEVCEASLKGGGGGWFRRRNIHCKRQNTPENV